MDYAITFGNRAFGTVTGGKLAGKVLNGERNEMMEHTQAEALAKLESYRDIFRGRLELYSRQWFDKKPATVPAGAEWVPSKRGRGGFLFVWNLATVEM